MRIEPKGMLEQWLRENGHLDKIAGFDVDDDRLERFLEEAERLFPEREEEYRQTWAVYVCATHRGYGKGELQRRVRLVDAVPDSKPQLLPPKTEVEAVESTKPACEFPGWLLLWAMAVLMLLAVIAIRS